MGRRLSWADEGPPLSARPIADEIPFDDEEAQADPGLPAGMRELAEQGLLQEEEVRLGILRQGGTYGISYQLPQGTTAAEVVPPLPDGVSVEVKWTSEQLPYLEVEVELSQEGRQIPSIRVRLAGAEKPELLLRLEMKAMGSRDGRPSSAHSDVRLIRSANQESIAATSEANAWRRGEQLARDDAEMVTSP